MGIPATAGLQGLVSGRSGPWEQRPGQVHVGFRDRSSVGFVADVAKLDLEDTLLPTRDRTADDDETTPTPPGHK